MAVGSLTSGKAAEVLFDSAVETHEEQMQMLDLVDFYEPNMGDQQNTGNQVWRPVQQHAPIQTGWDMTGLETGLIEETYPATLGTPDNDIVSLRIDDFRDKGFFERRGKESGMKLASNLNQAIATNIGNYGSLFFQTNATSGYDAIGEAQAMLNERQTPKTERRICMLNDRDTLKYGKDLAGRQTLQGQPDKTWATGQIGNNVAEFDVFTGSFLPTLAGASGVTTTTTAAVSDAPSAGSVNTSTGVVTNVDYRISSSIPVTSSASFVVGDYVTFSGVNSVGLTDKNDTGQLMTFKIVAIADATHIQVYPKPIAIGDAGLSTLELAYANVSAQIGSGATVTKINTTTSAKVNAFWAKSSVEVLGGNVPGELMQEFGGMKHLTTTLRNGQQMHMFYDGDMKAATLSWRIFMWYGITNKNPSANGVFTTY